MHSKGAEGMTNSVDPDQTGPQKEQSGLGLHRWADLYFQILGIFAVKLA